MTKHTLLANLHAGIDHLVAEALEAARASGRIAPVTEYAAYRFDIVTAWNQFEEAGLASLSRWDRDSLVGPLKRIFAMKALSDAQRHSSPNPRHPPWKPASWRRPRPSSLRARLPTGRAWPVRHTPAWCRGAFMSASRTGCPQ